MAIVKLTIKQPPIMSWGGDDQYKKVHNAGEEISRVIEQLTVAKRITSYLLQFPNLDVLVAIKNHWPHDIIVKNYPNNKATYTFGSVTITTQD